MDWSKINDDIFEEIAYCYAKDMYKEYNWVATGRSWDGNKDAYFSDMITPLHYYYKGWCEAKYTKVAGTSIPKSHMDSTLVSSILDGEVIFILFVTNGKITNEFMKRASAILVPHKIMVRFVEGDELSDWIKNRDDLLEKYFSLSTKYISSPTLQVSIIDTCFLNAVLDAPSLLSPISKLRTNKEYFLYLNIKTNHNITLIPKLSVNALKLVSQNSIQEYTLSPGYNSFLIRFIAKHPCNQETTLSLLSDNNNIQAQTKINLLIEDDDTPEIIYMEQDHILQEMFNCITTDTPQNMILQISGKEGNGKTHLIQKLISSVSNKYNEILTFQFSEKESANASILCKLILFINFGFLYELSDEAFSTLVESHTNLPNDLLWSLREGANNQVTALNVIDKVIKLVNQNSCSLFSTANIPMPQNSTYIFADDFHKISLRHSTLCRQIIEEFNTKSRFQIMIICNRPGEFHDNDLENVIKQVRFKQYNLNGISISDVYSSLQLNFNEGISKLADLFPVPVSVLHLELLVRKLKEKNIVILSKEKRAVCFSKAYEETNIINNRFAINKIKTCIYLDILYIIYKIESGVPIELLSMFFEKKFEIASKYIPFDLLVKEVNGNLIPYHDIYVYAFLQIDFQDKYMNELNDFLQFCLNKEINNPILYSNILSILIAKNNPLRFKYIGLAKEICKYYYSNSMYIAAQNLAIVLLPDLDETPKNEYQYNDLELLYIYAQAEKYTNSHIESTLYLQKIADIGSLMSLNSTQKGVIHEVHSELITNYLYALDFEEFEKELEYFNFNLKASTDISSSDHKINAYLNYLNRQMLYVYFTNKSNIEGIYKYAYSESIRLMREDYQGYADMDYGKILILDNPKYSLTLFKRSLAIFENHSQCKKREIDCKAMIVYVEHLNSKSSYDKLYDLQVEAKDKGYIHVYARISLLILTLELKNGEIPENVETKLLKLYIDYADLRDCNRLALFANQLLSAISFAKRDLEKYAKYTDVHLQLASKLSSNYVEVPTHNSKISNFSKSLFWFNKQNDLSNDGFWIDPRIW